MRHDEPEANEDRLIANIIRVMRKQLDRDYAAPATRRDAHPKHSALLKATFTVLPNLPAELRVGLFAEPRAYDAWIRTSSASAKIKSDAIKDVRGFAIKLLDVPGDKLAESDEPRTQDFVLLSMPNMPLGTVKLFHDAIYYTTEFSPLLFIAKMVLTGHARMLKELNAAKITPPSPLEIRYWSTTPYQFGADKVVKYSITPSSGLPTKLPSTLTDTYLTDAMERRLAGDTATFDFAVQFQKPNMAINDSAPRWDETVSPFLKVATLTIPAQAFRTEERNQLAEAFSFAPTHARVEHRPIGSINRARMQVYRAQSDYRHQRRGLAKTNV